MDVLTHAIEAYTSTLASDYTDGLAMQAIEMVFEYLPRAYQNGAADKEAREKCTTPPASPAWRLPMPSWGLTTPWRISSAVSITIPHGRANAILLPYIVAYNGQKPTKFAIFPKYETFVADKKFAKIAKHLGIAGKTTEESVANLVQAIKDLRASLNVPGSIQECGVDEKVFFDNLPRLADNAHADQCTTANPRYPLVSEIEQLYTDAYYGR